MERDYVRPRERESGMRFITRRRKTWADRQWRVSQLGHVFINTEGFSLTVFERGDGFGVAVARRGTDRQQTRKKSFHSQAAAKAAAPNALIWAKSHL